MNFSFIRKSKISSVFATSNVYYTCVLEVCEFFHNLGVFFTNIWHMNERVLKRFATIISSKFTSWQ